MKTKELKKLIEREPFRPFGVRLNNGATYTFNQPRDVGAPRDYHVIIYFGEKDAWEMIDADSIAEVISA